MPLVEDEEKANYKPTVEQKIAEEKLEFLAREICERMRVVLEIWIRKHIAAVSSLGEDEGFTDAVIGDMIAVETLLRIFNNSVPEYLKVDETLVRAFYRETLPKAIYQGHVDKSEDWSIVLPDSPLVTGFTRQLTAADGLQGIFAHMLTYVHNLNDLRIGGLQHVITFCTPGGERDDIGAQLLHLLVDVPGVRSLYVRVVMQSVMTILGYCHALIQAKKLGVPPESTQGTIAQSAATKRKISDALEQETFHDQVKSLTNRMTGEVLGIGKKHTTDGAKRSRSRSTLKRQDTVEVAPAAATEEGST